VVAEATQEGMARTGVVARLLLCTLRHFSEEQSLKTVELLRRYHGVATDGVVAGLDIAADEAGFSLGNHKAAYRIALDEGLPRTAHAGEARGPESVWETLETLRPTRIGHGVRSIEDRGLVEHLAETGVHLEVCPTCNVQIDIYPTFEAHPVDRLFKAGVSLGVNTDARTTTPTTLSADYGRMHDVFGWGKAELLRANQHALRSAFVGDEALRTELGAKLIEGYA